MIVYMAAVVATAFYLMALPLRLGIIVKTDREEILRIGASILGMRLMYGGKFARREGVDLFAVLTRKPDGSTRELKLNDLLSGTQTIKDSVRTLARAGRFLIRRVQVTRLSVAMNIASGDAARTAVLYGAATGAVQMVRTLRPSLPLQARIHADFHGVHGHASVCGIASIRLGHIIIAALIAAFDYAHGRISSWISTRSNRS